MDDESLLNKICGLKKITLKTILVGYSRKFGFSNVYSQELQKWTGPSTLNYHLGKVCGKNYLDDKSLLNKICGLKHILDLKKKIKRKCIFLT